MGLQRGTDLLTEGTWIALRPRAAARGGRRRCPVDAGFQSRFALIASSLAPWVLCCASLRARAPGASLRFSWRSTATWFTVAPVQCPWRAALWTSSRPSTAAWLGYYARLKRPRAVQCRTAVRRHFTSLTSLRWHFASAVQHEDDILRS